MSSAERTYPYRTPRGLFLNMTLFFGFMAGAMVWLALFNDQGMLWFNLIEWSPTGAKVFFWAMAGFFFLLFAGSLPLTLNAVFVAQRLALTSDALLVPRRFWSASDWRIPFVDIRDLIAHVDVAGQSR
jgi:hypothetical protein